MFFNADLEVPCYFNICDWICCCIKLGKEHLWHCIVYRFTVIRKKDYWVLLVPQYNKKICCTSCRVHMNNFFLIRHIDFRSRYRTLLRHLRRQSANPSCCFVLLYPKTAPKHVYVLQSWRNGSNTHCTGRGSRAWGGIWTQSWSPETVILLSESCALGSCGFRRAAVVARK